MGPAWTAQRPLPGGDIAGDAAAFAETLTKEYPKADPALLTGLARRHGSRARRMLGAAGAPGRDFGGGLCQREVDFLVAEEWAETADDVLWRRTKCGLHMTADQRRAVADYLSSRRSG